MLLRSTLATTMRLDGCNAEEILLVIRATITGALPLQEIACKCDAKPQDMPSISRGCSNQSCLSHPRLYCSLEQSQLDAACC